MDPRRQARECAVQMLFQIDVTRQSPEDVFSDYWAGRPVPAAAMGMAERLVRGTRDRIGQIDALIVAVASNWRLDRMAVVDRTVLRMATWELLHAPDTPPAAVIDEAIDLAKKFGGEESGQFVNGILDAIRRRVAGETQGEPARRKEGPAGDTVGRRRG